MDTLLSEIEAFKKRHDMSDWTFGEAALNDRHLVRQLAAGRELRRATEAKVRAFMATYTPAPEALAERAA